MSTPRLHPRHCTRPRKSRSWPRRPVMTSDACLVDTLSTILIARVWCAVADWVCDFYRAMHFSAKRGIAITCRLSVCLSVRLSVTLVDCDHIGWNSSKIISPLVSLECSLFATPTWRICSKANTPKFGPKVTQPPCWFERRRHSIANCGRMVTDSATVTMESL